MEIGVSNDVVDRMVRGCLAGGLINGGVRQAGHVYVFNFANYQIAFISTLLNL